MKKAQSGDVWFSKAARQRRERVAAQAKRDAAADEQRGADRMARAIVAALYWRAGEMLTRAVELADVPRATRHYLSDASALIGAAQRLEACWRCCALEWRPVTCGRPCCGTWSG